jgi:DNA mismatch repair protein MutL
MNRIRLLPEQVANQIAAGEVIERPASVVKELVENAIDADARHITVEIQAGGRACIRVMDDGVGMNRDDALLCLERHATSKIRTAHDLAVIQTMGFRGEALPSIASVSRFTLTTRERDADSPEGSQIIVHGGKILDVKSAGHAPGTTVEVRQLFYNLPARRKFLRSEETERTHVQHYLTLAALAHPEVGFTLQQDQRLIWQLPPATAGQSALEAVHHRLRSLLGGESRLLAVDESGTLPRPSRSGPDEEADDSSATSLEVRVWGYIGAPGVSRSTRQDQHLFVNRRPVEHRGLNYALLEGYHTSLMKGRYPVCCLFIAMDPSEVDVNVHPTKKEVKFRHEGAIRAQVTRAVNQTLLRFHTGTVAPAPPISAQDRTTSPTPAPTRANVPDDPETQPRDLPNLLPGTPASTAPPRAAPTTTSAAATPPTTPLQTPDSIQPMRPTEPRAERILSTTSAPQSESLAPGPTPSAALLAIPLRLVGVVGNLYVLFESDRGLVLMDQHAAHERVLYEQMLNRLEQDGAPSQRLLLPETVEVSPRDAQFLRDNLPTLARLGVGLSEFGDRTFLLDALPPFVKAADSRRFVLELVDELMAAGRDVNSLRLGEQMVAKTVCRHAVKARDPLSSLELEKLLKDLRCCAMPYTCPHGRPTLIEMNFRELEKKFGRTA